MTILVDADGVLENLSEAWVEYLNDRYGTSVKYDEVRDWDMTKAFPSLSREQVYGAELEPDFYDRLVPIEGAPRFLKQLIDDGHSVYVVTSTHFSVISQKLERVIFRYFPFLSRKDIIVCSNKQLIRGDVLIDDGVHNLVGGEYAKLLMSAPYNEDFDAEGNGMTRVGSWEEIYAVISRLSRST